ncbi:hypothetical protein [Streptomyces europaeiscabiei]|uniref:hypothetical protein n=1 Tax=Streptomyces europaeiscabiei TaxID=146819 RepID=UPI0029A8E04F|nr:hypothetical protein [Streptomyces europaeiscabiei]MDX3631745.1 hypothetical protein [Streptomyces europaeiscabiei]MDX3649526.1 hypothetical protein [Streptomyces europaeiscabiei]WUD34404.1 hypothetical protein OG858_25365 [Streptomyces europaeiscabiei]
MRTRKATVIAASVGVAVAAATGVTYASSALESAPQSASIVQDAAPVAPRGGNGTGTEAGSNAANAPADAGSKESWSGSKKSEGREDFRGENRRNHRDEGLIQINGREYPAEPGFCYTVAADAVVTTGTATFTVQNESDKTVRFFPRADCTGPLYTPVGAHTFNPGISVAGTGRLEASFYVVHKENDHH